MFFLLEINWIKSAIHPWQFFLPAFFLLPALTFAFSIARNPLFWLYVTTRIWSKIQSAQNICNLCLEKLIGICFHLFRSHPDKQIFMIVMSNSLLFKLRHYFSCVLLFSYVYILSFHFWKDTKKNIFFHDLIKFSLPLHCRIRLFTGHTIKTPNTDTCYAV